MKVTDEEMDFVKKEIVAVFVRMVRDSLEERIITTIDKENLRYRLETSLETTPSIAVHWHISFDVGVARNFLTIAREGKTIAKMKRTKEKGKKR